MYWSMVVPRACLFLRLGVTGDDRRREFAGARTAAGQFEAAYTSGARLPRCSVKTTQVGLAVVRATFAVPRDHAQHVLSGLHSQGFSIGLEGQPLKDCGRGRQVIRACTVETFEVPEDSIRELSALAGQEAIRELERLAGRLLGRPVRRLPFPEESTFRTWAEIYTASEMDETGFAVFAGSDAEADAQLRVIESVVGFSSRVSVRWPSGWNGYGWPRH